MGGGRWRGRERKEERKSGWLVARFCCCCCSYWSFDSCLFLTFYPTVSTSREATTTTVVVQHPSTAKLYTYIYVYYPRSLYRGWKTRANKLSCTLSFTLELLIVRFEIRKILVAKKKSNLTFDRNEKKKEKKEKREKFPVPGINETFFPEPG